MSTVSPLKSVSEARASTQVKFSLRAFFREVWASFARQSEMQVMLSSGYTQGLSKKAYVRAER